MQILRAEFLLNDWHNQRYITPNFINVTKFSDFLKNNYWQTAPNIEFTVAEHLYSEIVGGHTASLAKVCWPPEGSDEVELCITDLKWSDLSLVQMWLKNKTTVAVYSPNPNDTSCVLGYDAGILANISRICHIWTSNINSDPSDNYCSDRAY